MNEKTGVRVGIYQDLRNPPPWHRPWKQFYGQALERIEFAEQAGIDTVWCTEHHFFEDGYLPQPLTWSAAVAARTTKIGIGTAIVIAPLHKPIEVAEQAALVDQMSGGRFQLGLGVGYVAREFEHFDADMSRRFLLAEEHAAEIRRLLDGGILSPQRAQESIPMWFGGFGPRSARIAGRLGAGLLQLDLALLPHYRKALAQNDHAPSTEKMGGLVNMIVAHDPERAWAQIRPHLAWQWGTYARAGLEGVETAGSAALRDVTADIDPESMRSEGPVMNAPAFDVVTPEEAIRRLEEWLDGAPVSEIYFWDSIAAMPDQLVQEHIELLATKVKPALAGLRNAATGIA
jgi:alkanesulfonate monooxygenase SsuD/methylene tetrahydromethanopterin reductase-like flavin-dependent oxidoreductase (luciferase family)